MRFLYRLLHTRTTTCVLLVRRLRRGGVPLRTSTLKRLVFLLLAACVLLYGSLIRALLKQQLLPPPLGPAVVTPAPYWSHKVGGVRESSFEQRPPYHGGWAVRQRCRRPLDVLVFVMSEPREWARRAALRDTLFEEASLRRLNWSAVFFTRRCAADELVDAWLDVEASATGDLVLFSVDEVLGAASYTWVAAMRWVADHCPTVPRILMLDDDSLVQPDQDNGGGGGGGGDAASTQAVKCSSANMDVDVPAIKRRLEDAVDPVREQRQRQQAKEENYVTGKKKCVANTRRSSSLQRDDKAKL
ncbi:hypothetical protein HPB49_013792 [Dermacentor silvarum]|uniref:Uncharacterized protein n=1 Tax=Dermacentor silvarum TaxID=543639 RepID=A0ACB8DCV3_DERSI|nr:hypothetical protein HPB49_013792 [Dermacentor silvarum]